MKSVIVEESSISVEVSNAYNDDDVDIIDDIDDVDNADSDGVINVTGEPSFEPMKNRLMPPLTSGQQLLSRWSTSTSAISQHIRPPSAKGLSEHGHIRGCLLLKSFPFSP